MEKNIVAIDTRETFNGDLTVATFETRAEAVDFLLDNLNRFDDDYAVCFWKSDCGTKIEKSTRNRLDFSLLIFNSRQEAADWAEEAGLELKI